MDKVIEKELSYKLVGIFFEIQGELGIFCRERQYADVLEKKLIERRIEYRREIPVEIGGRKSNFVDFIVENKILVDLKAKPFIKKEDYYQMKRYLEVVGFELGLIVNFRDEYLKPRRVLNGKFIQKEQFVDSDKKFVALNRSKAFTMVELLVAMSLFIIFVVISTGGFVRALRTQRAIVALIAANDNASLTIEQMTREIRTGFGFSLTGNDLNFTNANGVPITYRLNGSTNVIERNENGDNFKPITATNVKINKLNFYLRGQLVGDGYPPRITIVINISPNIPTIQNISASFQTTVSARNLDT